MRDDLDDLLNKHASDKHSQNGYAPIYHAIFKHLRSAPIRLLEIGIGTMLPNVHSSMYGHDLPGYRPGASLRAWREYFPQGTIYGIDVQPDTMSASRDEPRIITALCDSTDAALVAELFRPCAPFDIIIDDGSHIAEHQLATLRNFFPHLEANGYYVIEDISTDPSQSRLLTDHRRELETIVGDNLYFVVRLPKADVVVISAR